MSPQTLQEQGWIRHAGDGQFQMWKPPTPGQVETIEADTHDAHRIGKTPTWEYSAGGEQHSGEDARSLREAFKVHLSEAVADQYGHWLKWPEQNAHINETLRYDPEIWEPNPAFTGDIYTSRPFVLKPSSGYAEGVMAAGAPAYTPIYRPNSTTLDTAMSVFRGVGPREAEAIRGLGRIESDRSGNLDGQENTTSYSLDPEQAESYASSFAYSHEKPTPGRPGYVLEVAKPGPSRVKAIRDKELDVLGATPVSHIKNAWEMRAGAIDADGPSHFVARKLAPEEIAQRFPSSKAALSDRASDLVPKYDDPVGPTVKPTPEVMAWHQGSHPFTKNEDGTPRHFYHGTSAKNFDALKPHDGLIFVTPSTSTADYFANSSERMITPSKHGNVVGDPTGEWTAREGSREYPVMAKALNPFDYENPAHVTALMDRLAHGGAMSSYDLTDGLRRGIEQGTWDQIERTSVVCAIKALKHDGIIVNENGRRNLAVFSPSQIKTLWNPRPTTDPRLMMSESASPFPESRYQEPVYHGSEHMFEAFDPASNVKFDNAPVNLSESTPAWVMTPDEFYAHPHVIRHGEVKGGGAHFALPGKSPFYDPQSDTATVYHLGQPVIADTRQQGVRDRLVAKALTMAPSKEIAERLVKIDRSKPFHFADVEGLGMEDAARALGYHGILKREDADDDNTPTTINLWDTSGVAEAGPNHHMQVRKAVAEGRPVPSHVRAAYGL